MLLAVKLVVSFIYLFGFIKFHAVFDLLLEFAIKLLLNILLAFICFLIDNKQFIITLKKIKLFYYFLGDNGSFSYPGFNFNIVIYYLCFHGRS